MKTISKQLAFASICLFLYSTVSAGLVIHPKRIVLEERERAAALDLLNDGENAARFQIFFEQKIMRPDGSIVDLAELDPDGIYAKDMIRYSPRRVDIQPGDRQTIRLAVRRPKELPEGEYVSHLVFQEIPVRTDSVQDEDEDLSVTVQPKLKIAIPILVRKGTLSASAGIEAVSFTPDIGKNGAFTATLTREGSVSLYGSVEVFAAENGKLGERLAVAKGVGVYTDVAKREIAVRLPRPLQAKQNEFVIRFDEDEQYGGTNLIEVAFQLPQ